MWQTATVGKGEPIRWHIALLLPSWKSARHFASIKTKQADTPLGYLYGRMLLMVRHDALCPPLRQQRWGKHKRERSVRKLVRPCQA
jgi:hypothetical protein